MKRTLIILLLMVGITGCGKDSEEITRVHRVEVKGLKIENVIKKETESYYETSGSAKAETLSIVSAKVMGAITSILVRNGDAVKRGQVLMTIDDSDISERVRAAEAAYQAALNGLLMAREDSSLADSTYERFKKLYDDNALTMQEMDEIGTKKRIALSRSRQAEALVEQSKAALREAKVYLEFTRVKSPVNGIVSEKRIDVGTMAAPGMPLVTIEDPSSYSIHINADEKLFQQIHKGLDVGVRIDALGLDINGKVSEITQSVDPRTRTFLVKIAVQDKSLRSGFFAQVRIPRGKTTLVLVPLSAVVRKGQLRGVYVVNNEGIISLRLIKTGKEVDGKAEVLSGLSGSERIVTDGVGRAVDGGIIVSERNTTAVPGE